MGGSGSCLPFSGDGPGRCCPSRASRSSAQEEQCIIRYRAAALGVGREEGGEGRGEEGRGGKGRGRGRDPSLLGVSYLLARVFELKPGATAPRKWH